MSPLRGSEYYLVYDKEQVLGFVLIGYGLEMNENSLGFKETWAYRYIVYKLAERIIRLQDEVKPIKRKLLNRQ